MLKLFKTKTMTAKKYTTCCDDECSVTSIDDTSASSSSSTAQHPVRQVSKPFEAATPLRAPSQQQEVLPPKAPKALPLLPLASQQALTRRESIRRPSPDRIPNNAHIARKCTKQRRNKPPVKTIQFQSCSFTDTDTNSKKANKEAGAGISSYLQLQIAYPADEWDTETETESETPTSALAQLSVVWYAE
jgi:hypothetical protein